MGHSHDENHVSSTSGSCVSALPLHLAHAAGGSTATVSAPHAASPQYQTGMRCPHHSWREMHQSLMLVIQCMYVLVHDSGMNLVLPSFTASIAGLASGAVLTNHCSDSIGSTTSSERWQRPSDSWCGSVLTSRPAASRSATTALRASATFMPRYFSGTF